MSRKTFGFVGIMFAISCASQLGAQLPCGEVGAAKTRNSIIVKMEYPPKSAKIDLEVFVDKNGQYKDARGNFFTAKQMANICKDKGTRESLSIAMFILEEDKMTVAAMGKAIRTMSQALDFGGGATLFVHLDAIGDLNKRRR